MSTCANTRGRGRGLSYDLPEAGAQDLLFYSSASYRLQPHQMQGHWWLLASGNGSEDFAENLGHWEGHGGPGERDHRWKWITCVLPLILAKTEGR